MNYLEINKLFSKMIIKTKNINVTIRVNKIREGLVIDKKVK